MGDTPLWSEPENGPQAGEVGEGQHTRQQSLGRLVHDSSQGFLQLAMSLVLTRC